MSALTIDLKHPSFQKNPQVDEEIGQWELEDQRAELKSKRERAERALDRLESGSFRCPHCHCVI
jgi:hypothetical protein